MLNLCLHELATNAAKYGALSNRSGKVYIGWEFIGEGGNRRVKLTWRERGGPMVSAPGRKSAHRAEPWRTGRKSFGI
jgi:two-component sensor histidine kinase